MNLLHRIFGMKKGIATVNQAKALMATIAEPKPTNTTNENLPKKVKDKLPDLLRRMEEVLVRAKSDEAVHEILQIERMKNEHLEKVIGAYLEIPKEHLNEIYAKTGKSASFHLSDAIDKMASRIEEISKTLAADKINVFSDNTSFVMQNYTDKSNQDENIFLKGI